MYTCDILSEQSIEVRLLVYRTSSCDSKELTSAQKFVAQLAMIPNLKIDYVVLNAGVLRYPNVSQTLSTLCKGAALTVVEGH
jgi:hypothetical protein